MKSFSKSGLLAAIFLGAASMPVLMKAESSLHVQKDGSAAEGSKLPGQIGELLKGLGLNLSDDQKKQLNGAIDQLKDGLKKAAEPQSEEKEQGEEAEAQPKKEGRNFKFEWRSDESPRKGRARIEPARPDAEEENANPHGQDQAQQLQKWLERNFNRGQGGGGSPFGDLFGDDFFGPFLRQLPQLRQSPQGNRPGGWQEFFEQMNGGGDNEEANTGYKNEKGHRSVLSEYRPIVKEARDSTIVLYKNGKQVAYGTIVTADGYALTKASEIEGKNANLEAEFQDGHYVSAKIVDQLKDYDLALVKLEASGLKPVQWNTAEVPVGSLLAAAGLDENPIAIGVVSVQPRNLNSSSKGFLGVGMDVGEGGVLVTMVSPKSPAEKAGIKEGDVILAIDGQKVTVPQQLSNYITGKKIEDEVHITYRRKDEEKTSVVTLTSRDDRTSDSGETISESKLKEAERLMDTTGRMGRKMSAVADNFPSAMQNDLIIDANECGGPILDLDGKAVGINIAASARTRTWALPANVLQSILSDVSNGKLHEPKDKSDLKREVRKADSEIEELTKRLEAAKELKQKREQELQLKNK